MIDYIIGDLGLSPTMAAEFIEWLGVYYDDPYTLPRDIVRDALPFFLVS